MKVDVEVYQDEVEGDNGKPIDGLRLVCERCGHEVEVFETSGASARMGAVKLREKCPNGEDNFYNVAWE